VSRDVKMSETFSDERKKGEKKKKEASTVS